MEKPFAISKKGFTACVAINNITSNEIRVLHFSSDDDLQFFFENQIWIFCQIPEITK
jgi:hypothetical protein